MYQKPPVHEKVFDFPNLKKDVEGKGGGLVGILEVMKERAVPIFDDMGKLLGKAIGAGISDAITDWKRDSAWADWFLPNTERSDLFNDIEGLQEDIAYRQHIGRITDDELLEKQKEGKRRMKRIGMVDIPQAAIMEVFEKGE